MRVVIHARVSTKDQSCDLQLRDLRAYCAARGFPELREYVDVGESGAKDSRPQLNELMANWHVIDAVAKRLSAVGEISGEELKEIFRQFKGTWKRLSKDPRR